MAVLSHCRASGDTKHVEKVTNGALRLPVFPRISQWDGVNRSGLLAVKKATKGGNIDVLSIKHFYTRGRTRR